MRAYYDYTYYRPRHKRYSYMTGNDVEYTYGTSGNETGRLVHIVDGSGSYECFYDALGNVTEDIRTIALPGNNDVYRFKTQYTYDSWGRMDQMIYPDGEVVSYKYIWGGDLFAMDGDKNGTLQSYIKGIHYNKFGQRDSVQYGNGTRAHYTYDALHRLYRLTSFQLGGAVMQNIKYTFDSVSNIKRIKNSVLAIGTLGGGYDNTFNYDGLHRLGGSQGDNTLGHYRYTMDYTTSGRITSKRLETPSSSLTGSVNMFYGYCNDQKPHTVRRIFEKKKKKHFDLRWDDAGNLGQISIGNEDAKFETGRFLFWTEDNRMHAAVDEKYSSYYVYDHSGERRVKLTGTNDLLDVNADYMYTASVLKEPTIYPSAYMVMSNKGYTKHYYAGAERVAARIGGGGLYVTEQDHRLSDKSGRVFKQSLEQINERLLENNDIDCIANGLFSTDKLAIEMNEVPERLQAELIIEYDEFRPIIDDAQNIHHNEPDVYFYHSDHLGSASWITDNSGLAVQHLQYLPYGERYVDQRAAGYHERFTFTGKERDEETGYGYFGARYMDHELMTMWLSVDPMADKYPSISPYAYCAWNPVKLVDPDGKKIRGVKYNYKTQQFSYSKGAIRRGTKRYIEARITTENGRKGIMDLVNSKRKFTIKVTDNPLFIDNGNKTYSQLHGKTIEDDYSLNTIIIVSTASKIQNSTVGYVVSNSKDKGEKNIDYNLISTDLNSGMEAVLKETGLRDFEAIHPYKSEEQLIHGIGAHEEEHALRPLDDERQEEVNAQKAEMRERIEYIKEVANE